ncbi:hypothetical protein EJ04DRAFT_522006 [Polyplosphaeria fusca]|uniref:Uncharacterized protein n=1 Tax=Polyplosphaeria fusca TaxID=682080 RepID=A0A9P4R0M5_9PLEO|nr:hypothetical protein EJ04DRAFT_522006 [Polyplosphaeria fusca]
MYFNKKCSVTERRALVAILAALVLCWLFVDTSHPNEHRISSMISKYQGPGYYLAYATLMVELYWQQWTWAIKKLFVLDGETFPKLRYQHGPKGSLCYTEADEHCDSTEWFRFILGGIHQTNKWWGFRSIMSIALGVYTFATFARLMMQYITTWDLGDEAGEAALRLGIADTATTLLRASIVFNPFLLLNFDHIVNAFLIGPIFNHFRSLETYFCWWFGVRAGLSYSTMFLMGIWPSSSPFAVGLDPARSVPQKLAKSGFSYMALSLGLSVWRQGEVRMRLRAPWPRTDHSLADREQALVLAGAVAVVLVSRWREIAEGLGHVIHIT